MDRIKQLRAERGVTQVEVARRAGIEPAVLCRIERGKASPNTRTLTKIATALDVDTGDLFARTREPATV